MLWYFAAQTSPETRGYDLNLALVVVLLVIIQKVSIDDHKTLK